MTTLKEHQAAMVNLLASGSGIPASASRLAHALHDVLALITTQPVAAVAHTERRGDATTPGLNDKLLALDVEAVRPMSWLERKVISSALAEGSRKAHRPESPWMQKGTRIKQLENTIRQLKGRVEILVQERDIARSDLQLSLAEIRCLKNPEQAGCRKEDTQVDFEIHSCKCYNPFSHFDEAMDLQVCDGCGGAK